jgi:hypothetical protein
MLRDRFTWTGYQAILWRTAIAAVVLLNCATVSWAATPQPCLRLDLTQMYPASNLDNPHFPGPQVFFTTAQGALALIPASGSSALASDDHDATWRNWAEFSTWPHPQGGDSYSGCGDVVRRGNDLLLFGTSGWYDKVVLWRSTNEGQTWTGPQTLASKMGQWGPSTTNQKVLTTSSGRIVVPFEVPLGPDTPPQCPDNVGTLYSDDGQSWAQSPIFGPPQGYPTAPEGFSEPSVVELPNGNLWMVIRALGGTLWQSFSTDDGATWGPPSSTGLVSPLSSVCAKRIPGSDAVITIWDNAGPAQGGSSFGAYWGPRSPMVFSISKDNCQTWSQPVAIDTGAAAYPAVCFSDDKMFLSYWRNSDPNGNIWAVDSHLMLVAYDVQSLLHTPEPGPLVLLGSALSAGLCFWARPATSISCRRSMTHWQTGLCAIWQRDFVTRGVK